MAEFLGQAELRDMFYSYLSFGVLIFVMYIAYLFDCLLHRLFKRERGGVKIIGSLLFRVTMGYLLCGLALFLVGLWLRPCLPGLITN